MPLRHLGRASRRSPATFPWTEEIGNSLVVREPVGVVGAITPWNYPLHQIVAKVAPALRRRLHGRAQAQRGRPAHRGHPGRDRRRGRRCPPARSTSCTATARSSARPSPRTRTSTWCRSPAPPGPGGGSSEVAAETDQAGRAGAGRQVGQRRPRRRRPRARRSSSGVAQRCINGGQTCTAWTRMLVPADRHDEAVEMAVAAAAQVHRRRPDRRVHPDRPDGLGRPAASGCTATSSSGVADGATVAFGGPGAGRGPRARLLRPPDGLRERRPGRRRSPRRRSSARCSR